MTVQLSNPGLEQLRRAWKDLNFRNTYKHIHEHNLFQRRSLKKLMIISLIYGSLLAYFVSLAI